MIHPPPRLIGNQEIEPAGKKGKAGQQIRPLHTELRTKYDNNNGIIPHAPSPASHQFWGQNPAGLYLSQTHLIRSQNNMNDLQGLPEYALESLNRMVSPFQKQNQKKPVTLVIGIVCRDSVVMVADSQTTDGDLKIHGADKIKIIKWAGGEAMVAQSGFSNISSHAIATIQERVTQQKQFSPNELPKLATEVLLDFRQREASTYTDKKLADWNENATRGFNQYLQDFQGFDLMLGFSHEGRPRLYTLNFARPHPEPAENNYATIGTHGGRVLSEHLLNEHINQQIDFEFASVIGIKAVERAIEFILGCGHLVKVKILHCEISGLGIQYDSYVEEFPAERVEEIVKIISTVEEQTKHVQIKRISEALKNRTERIFKEMEIDRRNALARSMANYLTQSRKPKQ